MSKKFPGDKNGIHGASSVPVRGGAVFHPSREQQIAQLAYEKAEARGFAPGHEMDDWLEAEAEIDGDLQPHLHTRRPVARPASHRR